MYVKRLTFQENTPVQDIDTMPEKRMIPLYVLLLHNADEPTMMKVSQILFRHTPLNEIESELVMLEAHRTGTGVVMVEPLETVEHFHDVLKAKGLITTIEAT